MDEKQRLNLEIKEVGAEGEGTFTGIASVFGVEDLGGDVINKGAFKKTIQERPEIPILWQHDQREVIGKGTVSEYQGKLMLKARLDMEDPIAQKAYRKLKERFISGLSIGFTAIKSGWKDIEGRMIREIDEAKLWEVSVVTFPMMPLAQVTAVKAQTSEDLIERLTALETENKALRAEVDTLKGAVEAKSAAANQPIEPVKDHSGAIRMLQELRQTLKGN